MFTRDIGPVTDSTNILNENIKENQKIGRVPKLKKGFRGTDY